MSAMPSSGLVGVSAQIDRGAAGLDRGADVVEVAEIGRRVRKAPRLSDFGEQPVGAAVGVVGDDDVARRGA